VCHYHCRWPCYSLVGQRLSGCEVEGRDPVTLDDITTAGFLRCDHSLTDRHEELRTTVCGHDTHLDSTRVFGCERVSETAVATSPRDNQTPCAVGELGCIQPFKCLCLQGCRAHPDCNGRGTLWERLEAQGGGGWCSCDTNWFGTLCQFKKSETCNRGQELSPPLHQFGP